MLCIRASLYTLTSDIYNTYVFEQLVKKFIIGYPCISWPWACLKYYQSSLYSHVAYMAEIMRVELGAIKQDLMAWILLMLQSCLSTTFVNRVDFGHTFFQWGCQFPPYSVSKTFLVTLLFFSKSTLLRKMCFQSQHAVQTHPGWRF